MRGLTIADERPDGVLAFDLVDILELCRDVATPLSWTLDGVECFGETAAELHALADSRAVVSGSELLRLARGLRQTVDGEFCGRGPDGAVVLLIRAVDSTEWDVFASDDVLLRLENRFHVTKPVPADA